MKILANMEEIIWTNLKQYKLINLYKSEVDKLYYMKEYYNNNKNKQLKFINLDRLCKKFNEYKKSIYNIEPFLFIRILI